MLQNHDATERPDAILLSAMTGPDKVDLVQSPDGTVMILLNDEQINGFQWAPTRVEEGVEMYMRILAVEPAA